MDFPVVKIPVFGILLALTTHVTSAQTNIAAVLAKSAGEQIGITKSYNPAYAKLAYPNGDVPMERGVCADVVVRSFRAAGLDLQKLIQEDIKRNFNAYPKNWGLTKPDPNIDHRRVPNLMKFFERTGKSLPATKQPSDYRAGDVVAWKLGGELFHIGIVSAERSRDGSRPLIIHNIGAGTRAEDRLFDFEIIGHYRW
jgi:uncharacterized protein YijF (DUF1287 family)